MNINAPTIKEWLSERTNHTQEYVLGFVFGTFCNRKGKDLSTSEIDQMLDEAIKFCDLPCDKVYMGEISSLLHGLREAKE